MQTRAHVLINKWGCFLLLYVRIYWGRRCLTPAWNKFWSGIITQVEMIFRNKEQFLYSVMLETWKELILTAIFFFFKYTSFLVFLDIFFCTLPHPSRRAHLAPSKYCLFHLKFITAQSSLRKYLMLQVVAAPFLYFLSRRMLSSALLQIDPMPFIHVLLGAEITYENNSSKF